MHYTALVPLTVMARSLKGEMQIGMGNCVLAISKMVAPLLIAPEGRRPHWALYCRLSLKSASKCVSRSDQTATHTACGIAK